MMHTFILRIIGTFYDPFVQNARSKILRAN